MLKSKYKARRGYCEGQNIRRIDPSESCSPKQLGIEIGRSIGVNENKTGENEEEVDANIANASEVLIPPRTAGKDSLHFQMEQNDVACSQKS